MSDTYDERIEGARGLLHSARRVAAFTGAGISTESGISDFRSLGGVWERYRIVTYQEFMAGAEARKEYWVMKKEFFHELKKARPNRAHLALARMERDGRLDCLITQNIDGLHQEAGNSKERIIELHGTNRQAECLGCGRRRPIEEVQKRLESGEEDPRCEDCEELLKPATVMFGQSMPEGEMRRAFECAAASDLLFMIGSSLQVQPAASIPRAAHQAGARLIFINRTETPWDHIAELHFREPAGEVMERIAAP